MGKTFLKWAGGKRWLVNNERDRLPTEYNRYIEPFLGGGAVFFYMSPRDAIISDVNQELINTYIAVRDNVEGVYHSLNVHSRNHSRDYYYAVRDMRPRTNHTLAARMIYLNKACFNGIYRVNKAGRFNVPFGTRTELTFEHDDLVQSSIALQRTEILCQDFETTVDLAQANDFLFCDPPYAVIDEENRFVSYNADVFSWGDQIRLANSLIRAKDRGVKILMTNVDHSAVRNLYENEDGFLLDTVQRQCFIAGNTEGRRAYHELIVTANM